MDGSSGHHWPEEELRPKKPRVRGTHSRLRSHTPMMMIEYLRHLFSIFLCFLSLSLSQLEDKPLLGVDTGVDRREWTLQHRKAADITLTPPQADMDMDCLDVNVKGPGNYPFKNKYKQRVLQCVYM